MRGPSVVYSSNENSNPLYDMWYWCKMTVWFNLIFWVLTSKAEKKAAAFGQGQHT